MVILASQNDALERRRDTLRAELASQNELNPLHRPLSRSPNRQARRRDNPDLRMGPINASLASQNELNQGAFDALDPRMDSNNAGLASQNESNQRGLLRARLNAEWASQNESNQGGLLRAGSRALHALNTPLPRLPNQAEVDWLTTPFDGSGTSFVFDRTGQASQAEFRTREAPARSRDTPARSRDALLSRSSQRREAPARTRDIQLSRSQGSHRREARIIPASAGEAPIIPAASQREARRRSLMPSQSEIQSAREARTITASAVEAPIMGPIMNPIIPDSARKAPIMGPIMGPLIPGSARETRTIPASVSNPWPRLPEIQSGVPLAETSSDRFRRLLSRAMETHEREAPRTENHRSDTRTFHVSIPNSELASQNQTMNLTSQQAGQAGHFQVSVPRVREAFRRDTNAPDVDQFNAILTQLSAERDLQNV